MLQTEVEYACSLDVKFLPLKIGLGSSIIIICFFDAEFL